MNALEIAQEFEEYLKEIEELPWGNHQILCDQAATMLRQQQAEIEELEKENTDLRYLIATKLEQQDGISLNSMAHPITNTPEPSYEIDPDKLETIEIDLPSPEPVAWMLVDASWNDFCRYSSYPSEGAIPLYTHPAELTDEEKLQFGMLFMNWNRSLKEPLVKPAYEQYVFEQAIAILRKAEEK